MAQLAREVKIHIFAVLLHLAEQAATAASTDAHTADHHVAGLLALWHRNWEALGVAQTETNAVDDLWEGHGLVEAYDAAHTRAWVTWERRCGDWVAFVLAAAESERAVV